MLWYEHSLPSVQEHDARKELSRQKTFLPFLLFTPLLVGAVAGNKPQSIAAKLSVASKTRGVENGYSFLHSVPDHRGGLRRDRGIFRTRKGARWIYRYSYHRSHWCLGRLFTYGKCGTESGRRVTHSCHLGGGDRRFLDWSVQTTSTGAALSLIHLVVRFDSVERFT